MLETKNEVYLYPCMGCGKELKVTITTSEATTEWGRIEAIKNTMRSSGFYVKFINQEMKEAACKKCRDSVIFQKKQKFEKFIAELNSLCEKFDFYVNFDEDSQGFEVTEAKTRTVLGELTCDENLRTFEGWSRLFIDY